MVTLNSLWAFDQIPTLNSPSLVQKQPQARPESPLPPQFRKVMKKETGHSQKYLYTALLALLHRCGFHWYYTCIGLHMLAVPSIGTYNYTRASNKRQNSSSKFSLRLMHVTTYHNHLSTYRIFCLGHNGKLYFVSNILSNWQIRSGDRSFYYCNDVAAKFHGFYSLSMFLIFILNDS